MVQKKIIALNLPQTLNQNLERIKRDIAAVPPTGKIPEHPSAVWQCRLMHVISITNIMTITWRFKLDNSISQ